MTYKEECELFKSYVDKMYDVFTKKRHDYGPTSEYTFEKFGLVSMLIRMYDKLGRLMNLCEKGKEPRVDESIEDTLFDLANYAMITVLEIDKMKMKTNTLRTSSGDGKIGEYF